jgi:hypothetical protein
MDCNSRKWESLTPKPEPHMLGEAAVVLESDGSNTDPVSGEGEGGTPEVPSFGRDESAGGALLSISFCEGPVSAAGAALRSLIFCFCSSVMGWAIFQNFSFMSLNL